MKPMNHGLNRLGRFRIESGGMRAHSKGFAKFEWLPDSRSAWSAVYSTAFRPTVHWQAQN